MANLAQLEAASKDLSTALGEIQSHYRYGETDSLGARPPQVLPTGVPPEVHRARESALASLNRLQVMLAEPTDLLKNLASHVQLLASIQWLGEYQVPACIPLEGTALVKDISNLIGVSESQLIRVIRMATTGGFLQEPQPGYVSHSEISAVFVTKPSYLDAAMFLAETAAPAALTMGTGIGHDSDSDERKDGVSCLSPFATAREAKLPRLQRQWPAYLRYGTGHVCDTATDVLTCLEGIRTVGARSTERAITLANQYPSLHFIVQLQSPRNDRLPPPNPKITISHRQPGSPQSISTAALYILNFPYPMPGPSAASTSTLFAAELRAHLPVLRLNRSATLVVIAPSTSELDEEVRLTRVRDLSLLQLARQRELRLPEVVNVLNGVSDGEGRMVLVNQVRSVEKHGVIALEVKYQPHEYVR
uniref:Winged helix repressor DNA-binding protein n=1 Tax=Penicillium oxalicum TaxID=69781 RepID=A0A2H4WV08_PENOX|nr:winged helix repressor DNA-binding protein [Penicillium oxalicum]